MKTIVIGLGNPILTDDGVGIRIVRELKKKLQAEGAGIQAEHGNAMVPIVHTLLPDIDVVELYAGGIRLIDALAGYERALIVDAMVTGTNDHGTISFFRLADFTSTRNTVSLHDMDLPMALELGSMVGIPLPCDIRIWGIEAKDVETFSEGLTKEVGMAVPVVLEEIMQELGITNCKLRSATQHGPEEFLIRNCNP